MLIHHSFEQCPILKLSSDPSVTPAGGWRDSRRTSRTRTCTITRWPARATSTGASSTPSITSWPRRRSWSLRKSPCSPGTRPSTRSLLASRCRCGTPTTSLQTTSWVRTDGKHLRLLCLFHLLNYKESIMALSVWLLHSSPLSRCHRAGPEPVPPRRQDGQAVLAGHDPEWARASHHLHLQAEESERLVAVRGPWWERWDGADGASWDNYKCLWISVKNKQLKKALKGVKDEVKSAEKKNVGKEGINENMIHKIHD